MSEGVSVKSKYRILTSILIGVGFGLSNCAAEEANYETILLETSDGLTIKDDVYEVDQTDASVILLFHQARFSRGEYCSIAPRLNELGFTCIAIDQRSGDKVKGVKNDTYIKASKLEMGTEYIDAYPDLELLLAHAKKTYPDQNILVWGSSYSASLAMVLATQHPEDVSAVLAFSPGIYFEVKGKSISEYATRIKCLVFMTCSREEVPSRMGIFNRIQHESKVFFKPEIEGYHGSKALWPENKGNEIYWGAVEAFLSSIKR